MHRRDFLIGGISGLTLFAVSGCVSPTPTPTPTTTPSVDPSPTPSATATQEPPLVPAPASMIRSNWSSDPFALGAFSYLSVGGTADHRAALAEPVADRVFFAGEATSDTEPGSVAGARDSGARAALEVMAVAEEGERIAVIGAGIAGATAARRLSDAGFDVTVLEARDRIGGRIDTRDERDWPLLAELGAARVSSDSPALAIRLAALDIETADIDGPREFRTPAGTELPPNDVGADTVAAAVRYAAERNGDFSLAGAITLSAPRDVAAPAEPTASAAPDTVDGPTEPSPEVPTTADWVSAYLRNVIAVDYAADGTALSASSGLTDGVRGGAQLVVGGYSALVREQLDGLRVSLSTVISEVVYSDRGVSLRLGTGESQQADRVVLTVPLGVLKSGDIRFDPPLPASKTLAARGIGMGAADVVWLRFEEPFWSTDAARWSVIGGDSVITEWINLEPVTGSPIVMGMVGGESAVRMSDLSDEDLIDRARRSLEPFLSA